MPEIPAVPGAGSLTERVDRFFDPDGPLAGSIDRFEPRPGQRALAAHVARTFELGGTLVAEAGTGTGKTLAYLVPAALAGRRVLVSTGTRPLQDQIFYKDLPALGRAQLPPADSASGFPLFPQRLPSQRSNVANHHPFAAGSPPNSPA